MRLDRKTGAAILAAVLLITVMLPLAGCSAKLSGAKPKPSQSTPSVSFLPSATAASPSPVPAQLKTLDAKAAGNVVSACGKIGLDVGGIGNFAFRDKWDKGSAYAFTYSGSEMNMYLRENGTVSSIEAGDVQVYLDGSAPLKIADYVGAKALTPAEYPESGHIFSNNGNNRIAPLEVVTQGKNAYYIKLEDAATHQTVLTFFIRPGETANVDVPLGDVKLKYATGSTWYDEEHLFGPRTTYSEAEGILSFKKENGQISGYTIELIMQTNGNLSTDEIKASDF
jgi:hypothetical protein